MTSVERRRMMGKRVKFYEVYEREVDENGNVKWIRKKPVMKLGWVVGFRTLREGKIIYHAPTSTSEDSYSYLLVTRTIKCMLVTTDPWYNPKKVPMDSWEKILSFPG